MYDSQKDRKAIAGRVILIYSILRLAVIGRRMSVTGMALRSRKRVLNKQKRSFRSRRAL